MILTQTDIDEFTDAYNLMVRLSLYCPLLPTRAAVADRAARFQGDSSRVVGGKVVVGFFWPDPSTPQAGSVVHTRLWR